MPDIPGRGTRKLSDVVAARLRQDIITGELEVGDQLKPKELASQLKVAVGTVRKALEILVEEQLVVVWHGVGTYVQRKPGDPLPAAAEASTGDGSAPWAQRILGLLEVIGERVASIESRVDDLEGRVDGFTRSDSISLQRDGLPKPPTRRRPRGPRSGT